MKLPDIDIDCKDRMEIVDRIKCVPASRFDMDAGLVPHISGVYFQDVPVDPLTNLSTIPYQYAEDHGYWKIDFLQKNAYQHVRSRQHLRELLKEPNWSLLEYEEIVQQLDQISEYPNMLKKMKPNSIDQLAMVIAMIRPGKQHLIGKPWKVIESTIWQKTDQGYTFKKAHAIAYAYVIVIQLNLIAEKFANSGSFSLD